MLNFDIIYQEFYSNKIEIVEVDSISSFAKLLTIENKTYLLIDKNLTDDNLKLDILVEMLSIFYFNFPTTRKEKLKALKFKNEYLKKYCLKDCLTTV